MRVFGCYHSDKPTRCFGYIIACGNTREEAYNAFINDPRYVIYAYKEQAYPLEEWNELPIITDKVYPRVLFFYDPTL